MAPKNAYGDDLSKAHSLTFHQLFGLKMKELSKIIQHSEDPETNYDAKTIKMW